MTIARNALNQEARAETDELRLQIADAEFRAVFVALSPADKAIRWRGLDYGAKFRLVCRQIEHLGGAWEQDVVEAQIAKYDAKYATGPVEAAVEGALERLALESSSAARQAETVADRAHFRRETTAYTNALVEYKRGVRPQLLNSGAWLLPSRRPGEAPHIITMDGDWVCSCKAGQSMHWPIALVIGCDVALDDMERFDDPPSDVLTERLAATGAALEAMSAPHMLTAQTAAMDAITAANAELGRRLCAAGRFDLRAA